VWTRVKVAASTNKEVDGHIPNYPNLPPQLICQLHDVTMHVRDFLPQEFLRCGDSSSAPFLYLMRALS